MSRLTREYAEQLAKTRTALFSWRLEGSVLHLSAASIEHARDGLVIHRALTNLEIAASKHDVVAASIDYMLADLRQAEALLDAAPADGVH
jgi:hypothetical protein